MHELGVAEEDLHAATSLHQTRHAYLWRWPIPESLDALKQLAAVGVPLGVVSNASGQIAEVLSRSGVCQAGDGLMWRCGSWSTVTSSVSPNPIH